MIHTHPFFLALSLVLTGVPIFSAYADDAVSVAAAYRGDLWRNVHGGAQKGGRYFDDFVARADVDMDKAVGLAGGAFSVTVLNNNGAHFSDQFVGAAQPVSSIETTSAFRLFEA